MANEIARKTLYGKPVLSLQDIAKIHGADYNYLNECFEDFRFLFDESKDYCVIGKDNWKDVKTYDIFEESIYMSLSHPIGLIEERPGNIYIAKDPNGKGVKVGMTKDKVHKRISQLNVGRSEPITEYMSYKCRDIVLAEKEAHNALDEYRMSGEWFSVDMEIAKQKVIEVINRVDSDIAEKKKAEVITYKQTELFTVDGYCRLFFEFIEYNEMSRIMAELTLRGYFKAAFPLVKKIAFTEESYRIYKEWAEENHLVKEIGLENGYANRTFRYVLYLTGQAEYDKLNI